MIPLILAALVSSSSVRLDEHVGAPIPRGLRFTDTTGAPVALGDVLEPGRPTLLVMAYARCTMLCSVVLRGVAEAVHASDRRPGRDFSLVVVSLDPHETIDEAARKQAHLLQDIGRTGDRTAWRYLVGAPDQVAALADTLGFRYAWDERTEQYAHPAVIFVLTPDARIAAYLRGVKWDASELDGALDRAARGELTTSAAQDLLRCFHFDPALRQYQGRIQAYFQIGASAVFAALSSLIIALVVWERRRTHRRAACSS
jgi:protein SCO1/2